MHAMRGWRGTSVAAAALLLALAGSVGGISAACAQPPSTAAATPSLASEITHGRFHRVPIRLPRGDVRRFVLWFAGEADATRRRQRLDALVADGAMVAVVDAGELERSLVADGGRCNFSSGDVENFSRYAQAYYRLSTYHLPLLLGDGEGAALAYAIAAQDNGATVAGAVAVDFCPTLAMAQSICPGKTLKLVPSRDGKSAQLQPAELTLPWLVAATPAQTPAHCKAEAIDAFVAGVPSARRFARTERGDAMPGARAALISLGAQRHVSVPPPPSDLKGLPVTEVPAQSGRGADTFAVFVSGDGGWAGLDQSVAATLAKEGIPVAGVDSLRYFWTPRTPAGFAADLDRIVRYYGLHWRRSKALLIGFSQGADVLPAAINRLPANTRAQVQLIALISVGRNADFEFHLTNWLGGSGGGLPIAPEVAKLPAGRVLCIYGRDDGDALCPRLSANEARVLAMPGDHHVNGDYDGLASRIVSAAASVAPAP